MQLQCSATSGGGTGFATIRIVFESTFPHQKRETPFGVSRFCVWAFGKADSKGGSWRQSGGLSQPPWLFRRKANPPFLLNQKTV